MEKEFIPYEQALALKELGFDEHCWCYFMNGVFNSSMFLKDYAYFKEMPQKHMEFILAPLYQQVFLWFRNKHSLHSWVTSKTIENNVVIYIPHGRTVPDTLKKGLVLDIIPYCNFKSVEDADLESLNKLIEIVKTK